MITARFPQINQISDSAYDKLFKMREPALDFDWKLKKTAIRNLVKVIKLTQCIIILTLRALKSQEKCIWKCHLLKLSAANNCLTLLVNLSIQAKSVDPEQTAPIGAVWSGSTLFAIEAS